MSTTQPTSDLFKKCSAIARAGALDALKARAIAGGFVSVICRQCWTYIEDTPCAISGLSYGLCAECFKTMEAERV